MIPCRNLLHVWNFVEQMAPLFYDISNIHIGDTRGGVIDFNSNSVRPVDKKKYSCFILKQAYTLGF
jgi:hypothetical protein